MTENDINKRLKELGFNNKYIDKFMIIYKRCMKLNIPYPFFYAFISLKN